MFVLIMSMMELTQPVVAIDLLARAVAEQQIDRLGQIADEAIALARDVRRRFNAETDSLAEAERGLSNALAAERDVGLTFSRITRASRLALALQTWVLKALAAIQAGVVVAPPAARAPAADEAQDDPGQIHKQRIARIVRRIANDDRDGESIDEVLRFAEDLWERLDDDDIWGDVTSRPIGEVVAQICEDLGLSPDWPELSREAWAQEEIQAGDPASPFAPLAPPGWGETPAPPDPDTS